MAKAKRRAYFKEMLSQKSNMIMYDIHCHILPQIDDGPSSIEKSLDMCRFAACQGIKAIVATPHYMYNNTMPFEMILPRISFLNQKLIDEDIELSILPGMEVPLFPDLVELYLKGNIMTLNLKNYLLIELPLNGIFPIYMYDVLFKLQLKGIKPVIAHPERCEIIIKEPDTAYSLVGSGCLMQINSGSIKGMFGRKVKKTALFLLKHGMAHVVASDNHPQYGRMSSLKESYNTIIKRFGEKLAYDLFIDNPNKIISGQEVYINI
jgi:protein-tyrosine phosphatase